jgi:outer membrane protein
MRRWMLGLLLVPAMTLGAQSVTRVGICDWTRVLNSSFKETKAYRDYFDTRDRILKDQAAIEQGISDLENRKLEADRSGDKPLSLQLEKQIADQRSYLDDFRRIKGDQLKTQAARITSSTDFVRQMIDVVKMISEAEGLALVIKSDGPGADLILYNIPEIDITDKVIAEIYNRAGKTWTGGTP